MSKLNIDISQLLKSRIGTSEVYSVNEPNLTARIEIMSVDNGLNVSILDLKAVEEANCEYCLKKYKQNVNFQGGERKFLTKAQKNDADPFEAFTIDTKNREIDLSEMLRQEIILHFPAISVCSTHCKGICAYCGKQKNMEECDCKEEVVEKHKPLAALKNLLK